MNISKADLLRIQRRLREFAAVREWEQFHTPKNLAMAAAVESGELLEIFQWLTPSESLTLDASHVSHVQEEIADVLIYLLRLADVLEIDVAAAIEAKIADNERKYPVSEAKGNATKYDRRGAGS